MSWLDRFRRKANPEGAYRAGLIRAGWDPICPSCSCSLVVARSVYESEYVLKVWGMCPQGHTNFQQVSYE